MMVFCVLRRELEDPAQGGGRRKRCYVLTGTTTLGVVATETAARPRLPRIVGYASQGVQQCEQRSSATSSRSSFRRSLSHSPRRSNPFSRRFPTLASQMEQANRFQYASTKHDE